jgi:hypothetical protein
MPVSCDGLSCGSGRTARASSVRGASSEAPSVVTMHGQCGRGEARAPDDPTAGFARSKFAADQHRAASRPELVHEQADTGRGVSPRPAIQSGRNFASGTSSPGVSRTLRSQVVPPPGCGPTSRSMPSAVIVPGHPGSRGGHRSPSNPGRLIPTLGVSDAATHDEVARWLRGSIGVSWPLALPDGARDRVRLRFGQVLVRVVAGAVRASRLVASTARSTAPAMLPRPIRRLRERSPDPGRPR